MQAKYPGVCAQCQAPINTGDPIEGAKDERGNTLWRHESCQAQPPEQEAAATPAPPPPDEEPKPELILTRDQLHYQTLCQMRAELDEAAQSIARAQSLQKVLEGSFVLPSEEIPF